MIVDDDAEYPQRSPQTVDVITWQRRETINNAQIGVGNAFFPAIFDLHIPMVEDFLSDSFRNR